MADFTYGGVGNTDRFGMGGSWSPAGTGFPSGFNPGGSTAGPRDTFGAPTFSGYDVSGINAGMNRDSVLGSTQQYSGLPDNYQRQGWEGPFGSAFGTFNPFSPNQGMAQTAPQPSLAGLLDPSQALNGGMPGTGMGALPGQGFGAGLSIPSPTPAGPRQPDKHPSVAAAATGLGLPGFRPGFQDPMPQNDMMAGAASLPSVAGFRPGFQDPMPQTANVPVPPSRPFDLGIASPAPQPAIGGFPMPPNRSMGLTDMGGGGGGGGGFPTTGDFSLGSSADRMAGVKSFTDPLSRQTVDTSPGGSWGGAAIGGLAGLAMGGPAGALAGGLLGYKAGGPISDGISSAFSGLGGLLSGPQDALSAPQAGGGWGGGFGGDGTNPGLR